MMLKYSVKLLSIFVVFGCFWFWGCNNNPSSAPSSNGSGFGNDPHVVGTWILEEATDCKTHSAVAAPDQDSYYFHYVTYTSTGGVVFETVNKPSMQRRTRTSDLGWRTKGDTLYLVATNGGTIGVDVAVIASSLSPLSYSIGYWNGERSTLTFRQDPRYMCADTYVFSKSSVERDY